MGPRFIPVGTGNTGRVRWDFFYLAVHPRGHGEHVQSLYRVITGSGSSPWARGTLINQLTQKISTRFIPVGTGNTINGGDYRAHLPVHPRGHGEHHIRVHFILFTSGSSPWARGTPPSTTATHCRQRFIPVGTGNTFHSCCSPLSLTVHPRGHGEHAFIRQPAPVIHGSSPWARGTP